MKTSTWLFAIVLLFSVVSADANETSPEGQPYTIGLTQTMANLTATLREIASPLSLGLIILSGIVYGLSYTQPAEIRGKWQTTAIGLFIGGVIIIAITLAAGGIQSNAGTLLTSS